MDNTVSVSSAKGYDCCVRCEGRTSRKILYVRCAKGYDCCVRFEVRTSRKTLYLSVLIRDMIAM
jgi:hypothetical protein